MNMENVLTELTSIPAPSGKEEERAVYISNYLKKYGYKPVIDEVGNVLVAFNVSLRDTQQGGQRGKLENNISKPDSSYVLLMAHMDTVFEDDKIHVVKNGNILNAPGIGDDTSNVVLLLQVLEYISIAEKTANTNVLFAFNVCEEGLGNLKGIRQIMKDYDGRIKEVISFDLMSDFICMKAVGSKRYEVTVKTEGGHSYHSFGKTNAIEVAADIISKIYRIKVDQDNTTKTTYNVGMIEGGTSVNTIAQSCRFCAEIRSDDKKKLNQIENKMLKIFKRRNEIQGDVEVTYELIGDRPTDGNVPMDRQEQLIARASKVIAKHTGVIPERKSGSTDCNVPLSLGIPAISFGGYRGGGTHTKQEWVDLTFLQTGYEMLREFVMQYYD